MKQKLFWAVVLLLAVTLAGQLYVQGRAPGGPTAHAVWGFQPQSFGEAVNYGSVIVLADVVSAGQGPDMVIPLKEEPGGVDRIPMQRITVNVVKVYKGDAAPGQTLVLQQTGGERAGAPPLTLADDPFYKAGERYVLILERVERADGLYQTVAPEGRLLVKGDGSVLSFGVSAVARDASSGNLARIEGWIADALSAPLGKGVNK